MKKMKKIIIILLFVFTGNSIYSQCFPDRHNSTWYDGWISCKASENPNNIRGESHWILYDFGENYFLHEMKIWNTNAPDLIDWGMQDVVIDISLNGIDWVEFGEFTFNQATGLNNYEGHLALDFEGVKAKYLLITGLTNYGGTCFGFSEIKIDVENTIGIEEEYTDNSCLETNIYPNPFSENLYMIVNSGCNSKNQTYKIINAYGQTIVPSSQIQNNKTIEILNKSSLSPGIYFVIIENDKTSIKKKLIKIH